MKTTHHLEANVFSCYAKIRYENIVLEKFNIIATAQRNFRKNLHKGFRSNFYLYDCSVCKGYHMTRHVDASNLARERGNQDRVKYQIDWEHNSIQQIGIGD